MAQYIPAFDYMIPHECPSLDWKPEPDQCPEGCCGPCFEIGGINSGFYKAAYSAILAVPPEQRKAMVVEFYQKNFWDRMLLGGIHSQDLANRVLDEGVNVGQKTAIRMLQQAVNIVRAEKIDVDAIIGLDTLDAVNETDEEQLIASYRQIRREHYENIASANPALEKYLAGWLARASE